MGDCSAVRPLAGVPYLSPAHGLVATGGTSVQAGSLSPALHPQALAPLPAPPGHSAQLSQGDGDSGHSPDTPGVVGASPCQAS